jgi:hypothetical protein
MAKGKGSIKRFLGIALSVVYFCMIIGFAVFYVRGGDILVKYLAGALGLNIKYSNWVSADEALVIKTAALDNMTLSFEPIKFHIKSDNAYFQFDYSKLMKDRAIGLGVSMLGPVFLYEGDRSGADKKDILSNVLPGFLKESKSAIYENVFEYVLVNILIYSDKVELSRVILYSKNFVAEIKGEIKMNGDLSINARLFFSPELAAELPPEAMQMLDDGLNGWKLYNFNIENNIEEKSFRLESPRLKFELGNFEVKESSQAGQ